MSKPRRTTITSSKLTSSKENRDPLLHLFWEGKLAEAEAGFELNFQYNEKKESGSTRNILSLTSSPSSSGAAAAASASTTQAFNTSSHVYSFDEALASVRYAHCLFVRTILSGDKMLPIDCIQRLTVAEECCISRCSALEELLMPSMEKFAQKNHSIVRRLSLKTSSTIPIVAKIGLASKYNPGEMSLNDIEYDLHKGFLTEWRTLQGFAAWSCLLRGVCQFLSNGYVKGGLSVRRAYSIVKFASMGADFEKSEPCPLHLVMGALQLLFINIPPHFISFLKAIGFVSDQEKGMEMLEHCLRADANSETHNFARLLLCAHFLLVSQQEYRTDRLEMFKKAENMVLDVLEGVPGKPPASASSTGVPSTRGKNWILYNWVYSHVLRRTGRIEEACTLLQKLCPTLEFDLLLFGKVYPREIINYRLHFDLGMLHFVQGDYQSAIDCIAPLITVDCKFSGRILGCAVLSACCALMNDEINAHKWLDFMDEYETGKGKMERSIHLWKLDTLLARPHKSLLAFELLYLYGYIKSFDSRVLSSSENKASSTWIGRIYKQIQAIYDASTVSVVYPEPPITLFTANEELLVSSLICGATASAMGNLEQAEKYLKITIENRDSKLISELYDPYMEPFALYELAAICIRKREYIQARAHLAKALKRSKKKNFSFYHTLSYKCVGAARYINEILGVKCEDPTESLVTYLGPDAGFQNQGAIPLATGGLVAGKSTSAEGTGVDSNSSNQNRRRSSWKMAFASGASKSMERNENPKTLTVQASMSAPDIILGASGAQASKVEGKTISHQDGLAELKMKAVIVAAGSKVSIPRQMKPYETVSWQYTVDDYDIDSHVEFFAATKKQEGKDAIIVTETERHDAGDFIEGFYSTQVAGTLIITFDNSFSMFTPKTVHYYIE